MPDFSRIEQSPLLLRLIAQTWSTTSSPRYPQPVENTTGLSTNGLANWLPVGKQSHPVLVPMLLPWFMLVFVHMARLHLHLLSDSTGETLEMIAKAALAQFDDADVTRHFWPMVRSRQHLERIMEEFKINPGLVLFTLANPETRSLLEDRLRALGLPHIAALDAVTHALADRLGQEAHARPGARHVMDQAYFDRVDAIQFTIAHDDGIGWENWEQAEIVLAGVSRTSKTPTSIYLANRGFKVANIPLVVESPPPPLLFELHKPMVVGLTTAPRRLIEIRRNRLLSLNERTETAYIDVERVEKEVSFARRMFADNGWPVIDVTRRSIEETAAAVIKLYQERQARAVPAEAGPKPI